MAFFRQIEQYRRGKMFIETASLLRQLRVWISVAWRIHECEYLFRVAKKRDEQLRDLLQWVGLAFSSAGSDFSAVGYHTQPCPGYACIGGERTSEICWEAPVCFTVYREGKPLVGMAVEFRGSALCIRQLQGVPGVKIPDSLQKWPALFILGAKNFIYYNRDVKSLRLYAADQRPSYWFPIMTLTAEEAKKYRQNLRRRYDGTARQQGFRQKNRKYWVWDLSVTKEQ